MNAKQILCVLLCLFSTMCVYADDLSTLNVSLEKPGTLKKIIKPKQYEQVTKLTLAGKLDESDLGVLYSLSNLEELYLANADFPSSYTWKVGKESHTHAFYSHDTRGYSTGCNPLIMNMPKLKTLQVPSYSNTLVVEGDSLHLDILWVGTKFTFQGNYTFRNVGVYDVKNSVVTKEFNRVTQQGKIYVEALYLYDANAIYHNRVIQQLNPLFLYFTSDQTQWLFNYMYDSEEEDFSKTTIKGLWEYSFAYTNIKKVNMGKISTIPTACFAGCEQLESVVMDNVTEIGASAFALSSLKSITISDKMETLNTSAFDQSAIETVYLTRQYAPEFISPGRTEHGWPIQTTPDQFVSHIEFVVPQGCLRKYQIGAWKNLLVRENIDMLNLTLQLDSVGSLKYKLTPDMYDRVQSLTLIGQADDIDLRIVEKCKFLRKLDLKNCKTYLSADTYLNSLAQLLSRIRYVNGLTNIAKDISEEQYEQRRISLRTALLTYAQAASTNSALSEIETKLVKEITETLDKRIVERDRGYMPEDFLKDSHLSEIILPDSYTKIDMELGGKTLRNVTVSPYATSISGFYDVPNLKPVVFPTTLTKLGNCFTHNNWTTIDLSKTQLESMSNEAFEGSKKVEEVRIPATFKKIETPNNKYSFRENLDVEHAITFYFYCDEAVERIGIYHKDKVHIPRGTRAGWPREYNPIDDLVVE